MKVFFSILISLILSLEHLFTSLIFSNPSKSLLISKISDSSKSFKGPTLLHFKQYDNSNRDDVSYCNDGLPITKAIDAKTGKLSEAFAPTV